MKRIIAFAILIIACVAAVSAKGDNGIAWSATNHDFGTIHASAGKVKAEYSFTNNTAEPVAVISMTNGGCGCTVPSFPRKPVAKGETATVTITFDPARFKGEFKRQVTVTLLINGKRVKSKLKFEGHIIPD